MAFISPHLFSILTKLPESRYLFSYFLFRRDLIKVLTFSLPLHLIIAHTVPTSDGIQQIITGYRWGLAGPGYLYLKTRNKYYCKHAKVSTYSFLFVVEEYHTSEC